EERATTYVNLVAMMVDGLGKGLPIALTDARAAVAKAHEFRADLKPAHRDYLESLTTDLDKAAFGIDDAMRSIALLVGEDRRLVRDFARPDRLYFKWFSAGPATRTMLFLHEDDGRTDGSMSVSYGDETVTATFAAACPACDASRSVTIPLLLPFTDDA